MQIPATFLPTVGDAAGASVIPAGVQPLPATNLLASFENLLDQALYVAGLPCPMPPAPVTVPVVPQSLSSLPVMQPPLFAPEALSTEEAVAEISGSTEFSPPGLEAVPQPRFGPTVAQTPAEATPAPTNVIALPQGQAPSALPAPIAPSGPQSDEVLGFRVEISTEPTATPSPPPMQSHESPIVESRSLPPVIPQPTMRAYHEASASGETSSVVRVPEQSIQPSLPEKQAEPFDASQDTVRESSSFSMEAVSPRLQSVEKESAPVQGSTPQVDQIRDAVLSRRDEVERAGRAEIHLRLDPPELGRIHLHLSGDASHLTGRLVVEEHATQALLENQMQVIQQRLEQAGITVSKFEVAWQGDGQSGAWREAQQGFAELYAQPGRSRRGGSPPSPVRGGRGVIDVLA